MTVKSSSLCGAVCRVWRAGCGGATMVLYGVVAIAALAVVISIIWVTDKIVR
jgi:hypothetical protein